MEQVFDAQVFMPRQNDLEFIAANKNKMKLNSSSKVNLQDHGVGLILTLIRLELILAHVSLIYIGNFFKAMTIHRIQIHLNCFKFQ